MARNAVTVQEVLSGALAPLQAVGAADQLSQQMVRLTTQLQQLQGASQVAAETTRANTVAVASSSVASKVANATHSAVSTGVAGSLVLGLGLSPLISAVARLFGGGSSSAPPALVKFALPDAVNASAGVSAAIPGGPFAVDYAQGAPRPVTRPADVVPAQVTVQVQALDSQSFLDHSNDIAMAVRQAMLESSVLNDVIRGA